jgi:hypothetical protein
MSSISNLENEKGDVNGTSIVSKESSSMETSARTTLTTMDSMDGGVDDEELVQDVTDEEENLFISLEQEKDKEDADEALRSHPELTDSSSAPRLLQEALKKGQVKVDDPSDATVALNESGGMKTVENGDPNGFGDSASDKSHQQQHRVSASIV